MNTVLLTIDDVASRNTPAIVDELCSRGITAIMFATGMNVERFYDEALYAVRKGMIVGNHSYSHPAFSSLTAEEGIEEIRKCEAVLDRLYHDAGVVRSYRPFRFPYGDKGGENKAVLQRYLAQQHFDKVNDRHMAGTQGLMMTWSWRKYKELLDDFDEDENEPKLTLPSQVIH